MTDLEMRLQVVKDCEVRQSVMVIARPLGTSHSVIAAFLKSKNKAMEAVKMSALWKGTRLTKI